jgi:nitrogen fixation/metabolism regulation signal transduction histidine kinase
LDVAGVIQQPFIWPVVLVGLAFMSSMAGGALSGMVIAGKQFGAQLATQMGGLFGLLAGVPGVVLALLILMLTG